MGTWYVPPTRERVGTDAFVLDFPAFLRCGYVPPLQTMSSADETTGLALVRFVGCFVYTVFWVSVLPRLAVPADSSPDFNAKRTRLLDTGQFIRFHDQVRSSRVSFSCLLHPCRPFRLISLCSPSREDAVPSLVDPAVNLLLFLFFSRSRAPSRILRTWPLVSALLRAARSRS